MMGKSYGADALSVLLDTHRPDEATDEDQASLLKWFDLRQDGLYVMEQAGGDDGMVDVITGDYARRRKAGLPLLSIPFSSKQLTQFEEAYGGLFSSLLEAGEDTPALLEDIRGRNTDAAELAEVLLGLRAGAEAEPQVEPGPSATDIGMSKSGLIAAHQSEWPTIARDIADAAGNGLANAAKAGKRGWREADALAWARAKGKLTCRPESTAVLDQALHNLVSLPRRVIRSPR